MLKGTDYPPNWVVLSGSSLTTEFAMREWTKKSVIEICGNREGFVSLGNLLLWVSSQSDTEPLTITDLPFVHSKSALSLTVVQPMHGSESHGKLVRVDKDQQFQWLIKDEVLEREAINLVDLGLSAWFYPDGNHNHACLDPDAEYELFFALEGNT